MGLYFNKDISTLFVGSDAVKAVYMGGTLVWPTGLPVGTTFNFKYTGEVQSVELPPGKYKLQCWGAQGGTSYADSNGVGSKGGYSEGVLTLNETTTLYVFVGGKGSRGSSESLVNGGWNGGGASVGYSSYNSGGEYGYSCPACGGGATDICTVTSSMSYSSGRTNRSSASLLSRIIVAGGGAGGSYRYTSTTTTTTVKGRVDRYKAYDYGYEVDLVFKPTDEWPYGSSYTIKGVPSEYSYTSYWDASFSILYVIITTTQGSPQGTIQYETVYVEYDKSTSSESSSSGYSNQSQQGGGTSGKGQFPGTQTSAGSGGGFGYGGNQTTTNYRYCSGGGGGGWYGGGCGHSDSSTSYIDYTGGGSGFVNTSSNASSRPSGYSGLQLDSGTTTAGDTSHPSTSGATETGHSGNGYAKITVLDGSGSSGGGSTAASISWSVQTGNWTEGSNSSAKDGKLFTSVSPGTSSSTRLRCTFSGVTSITFNCVYNGESNYDYLTVGSLDSTCTRDSYGTTLKETSGTAKDITFSCDSGTHYVEFCYSKDGSVDTAPDCAVVYVKSYS